MLTNRIFLGLLVLIALGVSATGIAIGVIAWSPTPIFDQWDEATPDQINNLLAPHNEHRIALSRLIFHADLAFARGTGIVNVASIFAFGFFQVCLFILAARWKWPSADPRLLIGVACLASAFQFSGFQFENFSSGFQNQFPGVFLCASIALTTLCAAADAKNGRKWILVTLAGLAAVVGTMCMANGLLIAPLLFLVAIVLRMKFVPRAMLALTLGSGFLYAKDYATGLGSGALAAIFADPVRLVANILAYCGGALPNSIAVLGRLEPIQPHIAMAFGAIAVLSVSAMCVHTLRLPASQRPRAALWAGIGLFVLASAAATALGRSGLGEHPTLASRYGAASAVLWTAVASWGLMQVRVVPNLLRLAVVGVVCLILAAAQIAWIGGAEDYKARRLEAEAALLVDADAKQALSGVYPVPERVRSVGKSLRASNLAMYYEPWRRMFGQVLSDTPVACAGEVASVSLVQDASDPTWRVTISGKMSSETRGIAIVGVERTVVGILIRGVHGDINSTLFGSNDAPPLWGGYVRPEAQTSKLFAAYAVQVDGKPLCRLLAAVSLNSG